MDTLLEEYGGAVIAVLAVVVMAGFLLGLFCQDGVLGQVLTSVAGSVS
ncbi:MAG: hypothetical protein K2O73_08745 [Lachnospiraceae bacterium]|nr:hypothetical protein [Lachnospiraceae bacterium]MDE7434373.1 hypothetical protein [Lachnospiraceae bacterium]